MLKTLTRWFGLAFGLGLSRKVAEAYTYLIDFWEPNDRVFLFGFSRGAYTARVLAGLLHQLGLLPRGNYNLIPYAMKYFRRITEARHHQSRRSPRANGNSCATISGIHSLARSTQETTNGGFKCISWAFGTRCHRLGGYGIPSISLSQPIIRASSTSATLSQSTNVVRSFVKICFDRHLARTFSSCGFLVCIPTLAGVFHQKAVDSGGIRSNGCKSKRRVLAYISMQQN